MRRKPVPRAGAAADAYEVEPCVRPRPSLRARLAARRATRRAQDAKRSIACTSTPPTAASSPTAVHGGPAGHRDLWRRGRGRCRRRRCAGPDPATVPARATCCRWGRCTPSRATNSRWRRWRPAGRAASAAGGDRRPRRDPRAARGPGRRHVEFEVREKLPFPQLVERYRHAGVVACGQVREPLASSRWRRWPPQRPWWRWPREAFARPWWTGRRACWSLATPLCSAGRCGASLDSPGLAARLGQRGRAVTERDWTWERTAAGYDRLLAELAARAKARGRR